LEFFVAICLGFFSKSFSIFVFIFTKGNFVIGGTLAIFGCLGGKNIVTIESLGGHYHLGGNLKGHVNFLQV
jgi:S-adenosylmethionine synthetase